MLRVYMTRGRGKEPETEFCNVTKKEMDETGREGAP